MKPRRPTELKVAAISLFIWLAALGITLSVLALQSCITPEPYPVKNSGGQRAH